MPHCRSQENLENEIEILEEEKKNIETEMNNEISDNQKLQDMANRYKEIIEDLDIKSMRWLELEEKEG